MRNRIIAIIICCSFCSSLVAQAYKKTVRPVKNVILMIPDGTSVGVVSSARWLQIYKGGSQHLHIDPYFTGLVKTFSSNAPIGDSAPTTSAYMTGQAQRTGNVSIYPEADPGKDLVVVDATRAFQPLATILEAAKVEQNKATGLVVTCEFPHATPADCAAHYYNRGKYQYIAQQMAYNNLDVMFGGGNKEITNDIKAHFTQSGAKLIQDDLQAFRTYNEKGPMWALFDEMAMPYDLDRDQTKIPSLEEMTKKAIDRLSQNENGFFLMVEGSKVDWAAHGNDVPGCISEFLAFDRAVGAAIDFAKKDGNTVVLILPDHGNSGFSLGSARCPGYDKLSLEQLFERMSKFQLTGKGLTDLIKITENNQVAQVFEAKTGIRLTEDQLKTIAVCKESGYKANTIPDVHSLGKYLTDILTDNTCIGFTTSGHTGEDVFLAAYHPQGDVPAGLNTNKDINNYMFDALGLNKPLDQITQDLFAKHTAVFNGLTYKIDKSTDFPTLTVTKGKTKLVVPSFKSEVYLNGKTIPLKSVTVYIDKNDTFYLPATLRALIN